MLLQRVLSLLPMFNQNTYNFTYNYTSTHGLSIETIDQLFELHRILVSTPSVSFDEREVGYELSRYLQSQGLTVEHQYISDSRFNVFAYKGAINETQVLLTSHIDTVPPHFSYGVSEDGTKIHGRGSCDDKASVASQVIAFLELIDELEDGKVSLLFDVGEEYGGDGIRYVEREVDYHWDTVIFGEPTELKLGVGHKGGYGGVINVTGLASHSGYPELGVDANGILIDVLSNLKNLELPSNDLLGNSSLNIGLIEGGVAGNVISPHASASLLFRVTGELNQFPSLVRQAIEETEFASHIEYIEYDFKEGPVFFEHQIPGFQSIVLGYGTDAFALKKNDIPHKILYGPGTIHVAHGPNEHVTTDDLIQAVQGYKSLIKWSLEQ